VNRTWNDLWCDLRNRKGTPWNVRSLYWSGSLTTVAREISRYKSDLVGVQEARWDKGGSVNADDYVWGRGEMYAGFWWGNLREQAHLEDTGVDGRIFRKWDGGMDWIDLAQDRDRWREIVNAVMNLRVP